MDKVQSVIDSNSKKFYTIFRKEKGKELLWQSVEKELAKKDFLWSQLYSRM
jgi:hypothetical protein